ncbi:MAG: hypothetical protein JKY67_10075 [Pseudomonadales bacterium]|nr:hypothetical protein [Pseudomonadales bacterium]
MSEQSKHHQQLLLHIATSFKTGKFQEQRLPLIETISRLEQDLLKVESRMRHLHKEYQRIFPSEFPLGLVIQKNRSRPSLYWRGRDCYWSQSYVKLFQCPSWTGFIRQQPKNVRDMLELFEANRLALEWEYRTKYQALKALRDWLKDVDLALVSTGG